MLTSILIGVAVFAAQVVGYRVVSKKLAVRRAVKRRLASLVYEQPAARVHPGFARNRPGEN